MEHNVYLMCPPILVHTSGIDVYAYFQRMRVEFIVINGNVVIILVLLFGNVYVNR